MGREEREGTVTTHFHWMLQARHSGSRAPPKGTLGLPGDDSQQRWTGIDTLLFTV